MKKSIKLIFYFILPLNSLFGQNNHNIGLQEKKVSISEIKNIKGFFGHRININKEYIKNFPIDTYIDFIVNRQHTKWDWTKAEQHGKWIESASMTALQSGDKEINLKLQQVLKRIIGSQEENGYIGATAKSFRTEKRPVRGMDAYELYFVFHAFLTVYEESGNKEALHAAEKLADYYLKYFGPGKLEFWPSKLKYPENKFKHISTLSDFAGHGVHYSWEGTLLCDPVARLYEITGKKKYLDWSLWVVNNIDKWSGWNAFSRLDSVASKDIGIDKLQPYVHSHTFQMNFMGFLRLYRITGDKSFLKKVMGAWDDISERQMYITGGVSVAEHYEHDYVKPITGNIIETCATMSWMQLTQMLLELTKDIKYADAIERLMINHVFAAQDCETGVCRYHTAPNGDKPSGDHGFFHGPDCCTASGHRIISLLPSFFYAENKNCFFINQYIPAKYENENFSFHITGNYPETENIEIIISDDIKKRKKLLLRIPGWCKKPKALLNGKNIKEVNTGEYLKINRKWKKGDKITLYFPMEEKWIKRKYHSIYTTYNLPNGEIMYREEPTNRIPYAFIKGPIVYCVDMVWNKHIGNDILDLEKDFCIDLNYQPKRINKPYNKMLGPVFQTNGYYKGNKVNIILTPFTNSSQWFRPGEKKPNKNDVAFSYGIWLYEKDK